MLDAERQADRSVLLSCTTSSRRYVLHQKRPATFFIDTPMYGVGDSERCIEIPWSMARYRGESCVLDVGYANARTPFSSGTQYPENPYPDRPGHSCYSSARHFGVAGDALAPPFLPGTFDLIFAISVVEHIGRDNSFILAATSQRRNSEIWRWPPLWLSVETGGRLLVTVPFGRLEEHGWFVQYDLRRIVALLEATGCDLTLAEYYRYGSDGWHGPVDPLTLSDVGYRPGFGAGAVACLELSRGNGELRRLASVLSKIDYPPGLPFPRPHDAPVKPERREPEPQQPQVVGLAKPVGRGQGDKCGSRTSE